MALEKCPECGKEMSSTALTCPHCGFAGKKIAKRNNVFIKIMAVVILIAAGFGMYKYVNYQKEEQAKKERAAANYWKTYNERYHVPSKQK